MKPCSCGFDGIGEIKGIFFKADGEPHHIPFNCPCGTTRGISWAEAPDELRHLAVEVEDKRLRVNTAS